MLFWRWMPGWAPDSTSVDGQGAQAWSSGTGHTFEFSVPLASGDSEDLTALAGDTVGFMVSYQEEGPTYSDWPTGAFWSDATTYGDLVLAAGPTPTPA